MGYAIAAVSPPRYQWEASSLYSQPYNCGPTSVTKIACFYKDTWFGIEATRKLIAGMGPYHVNQDIYYGAPQGTATNAWQQTEMLRKRGVPCDVRQISTLSELHGLIDTGRRPILVGIEMSKVPFEIKGHNFLGWHAVVFLGLAYDRFGNRGVLVNDPNFAPGSDDSKGKRFYPDWILQSAWLNNSPRYCVVPKYLKPVTLLPDTSMGDELATLEQMTIPADAGRLFDVAKGVTLRKLPFATATKHFTTVVPVKYRLVGFSPGGWVGAANPNDPVGVFFVPPNH